MVRKAKKRLGVGARCTVLLKRLHPQDVICAKIQNYGAQDRLEDLIVVKRERITRRGHTYLGVFFSSASLPGTC